MHLNAFRVYDEVTARVKGDYLLPSLSNNKSKQTLSNFLFHLFVAFMPKTSNQLFLAHISI